MSMLILARMKHKRKYGNIPFIIIFCCTVMKEMESNVRNHKKIFKKQLGFQQVCLCTKTQNCETLYLRTYSFSPRGQSPCADRTDSHQPSDFPEAPGLLGCVVQHRSPTCGISVSPLVFENSVCLFVWRHPLKNSARFCL